MRPTLAAIALALALGGPAMAQDTDPAPVSTPSRADERAAMVRTQLAARDITDARVLDAFRAVPREAFVPERHGALAYADRPVPIGPQATISQPYIVALMTQLADVQPGEKVLEIGTGSGYQAAILDTLGAQVWTMELQEPLSKQARRNLKAAGHTGVRTIVGDGWSGWPSDAPYDAILVTAAPPEIPEPLVAQLADGGRLVIPVGDDEQTLVVLTKRDGTLERTDAARVTFVPLQRR